MIAQRVRPGQGLTARRARGIALQSARSLESGQLMRAVAKGALARLATTTECHDGPIYDDLDPVLILKAGRAAHQQRAVAVGGDDNVRHLTDLGLGEPLRGFCGARHA